MPAGQTHNKVIVAVVFLWLSFIAISFFGKNQSSEFNFFKTDCKLLQSCSFIILQKRQTDIFHYNHGKLSLLTIHRDPDTKLLSQHVEIGIFLQCCQCVQYIRTFAVLQWLQIDEKVLGKDEQRGKGKQLSYSPRARARGRT